MDSSSQEGGKKKKIAEVKTFPVPFPLISSKSNGTLNVCILLKDILFMIYQDKGFQYYQY